MIRIGIVGCGRILAAHLRGYRRLRQAGVDDFRITALCARRADDAYSYLRRGDGPPQRQPISHDAADPLAVGDEYVSDFQDDVEVAVYTDYRRMIAEAPIDAVNDFTSHALHHQVAAAAFAHGKALLTQKPLAVSVAAAHRMCEEARSRNLVFGVFENFRHLHNTRHLKWLLDSGRLGTLQMILLGYVGAWWAPDRIVAETPWRHRRTEGGGITLDLAVHFFDQFRHLAGEITTVSAHTAVIEAVRVTRDARGREMERVECDADDTFFAQFSTDRGVVGNLAASWAGHAAPTIAGRGSVFYGTRGRVTGDEVTFDNSQAATLSGLYQSAADPVEQQRDFPLGLDDSFALGQHDWLEAVRHRREPQTSGREGLRDLAAAFAILESAHAGRRVNVAQVEHGDVREYQRPIDVFFGLI